MEIEGKVIQILPVQEGVSKQGKPWKEQSFIIETQEQYAKKVCISLFGETLVNNNPVSLDAVVKVQYDLESREFNGRWYTSVRAWKVEPSQQANTTAAPTPAPDPFAGGGDDLFGNQETADPFAA